MSYSKDEFMQIMSLADKLEEVVEHGDLVYGLVALTVVIARGGRIVIEKSEGEFTKQDLLDLVNEKVDYWHDFYDHLDGVTDLKRNSNDDIQTIMMEICRIALEDQDIYHRIAHELDLSDDEMDKIRDFVKLENDHAKT